MHPTEESARQGVAESARIDRNKNDRQRDDYDALGGKKQERFVNLEKNGGKKKTEPAAEAGRGCD